MFQQVLDSSSTSFKKNIIDLESLHIPNVYIASVYNLLDKTLATTPSCLPLPLFPSSSTTKVDLEEDAGGEFGASSSLTPSVLSDIVPQSENLTILDCFRGRIFLLEDFQSLFYYPNKSAFGFAPAKKMHPALSLASQTFTSLKKTRFFSLYSAVLEGYCTQKNITVANLTPTKLIQLRREIFAFPTLREFKGQCFASSWDEIEQLLLQEQTFQRALHAKKPPRFVTCECYFHAVFKSITLNGYTHTTRFRYLVRIPLEPILKRQGVVWSSMFSDYCHVRPKVNVDNCSSDCCESEIGNSSPSCDIFDHDYIRQIGTYMEMYLKGKICDATDFNQEHVSALTSQILSLELLCPDFECLRTILMLYVKILSLILYGKFTENELVELRAKLAAAEKDSKILHDPTLLKEYIDEMNRGMKLQLDVQFTAPLLEIDPLYLKYICQYGIPPNLVFDPILLKELEGLEELEEEEMAHHHHHQCK
jgi:hypothetical protein